MVNEEKAHIILDKIFDSYDIKIKRQRIIDKELKKYGLKRYSGYLRILNNIIN